MKADPNLPQRVITRHPSNQGSVIILDMFGKTIELFVADAKYRATKAWASGSTLKTDIPAMECFTNDYKRLNPSNVSDVQTDGLQYALTDAQLQELFPSFKTDKTAKENTDILMSYEDTDAAHHCRSQIIDGVGAMDLPNFNELIVIYLESDRIDELDPTVESYPQYALGTKNPYGRFNFDTKCAALSSTVFSKGLARCVNAIGSATYGAMSYVFGVAPVLELSVND